MKSKLEVMEIKLGNEDDMGGMEIEVGGEEGDGRDAQGKSTLKEIKVGMKITKERAGSYRDEKGRNGGEADLMPSKRLI